MPDSRKICCFCESDHLSLMYNRQFHHFKKDHGPFDFYLCRNCGSGVTIPVPTSEQLAALYHSFDGGINPRLRESRRSNPLTAWYVQCLERALKRRKRNLDSSSVFSWVDVGAGAGELSKLISENFPRSKGIAVDFHECPALLKDVKNVNWVRQDLNETDFSVLFPNSADLVFSLAVLEHIQHPDEFAFKLVKLAKPESGVVYTAQPDFGSFSRKFWRKQWPFYLPGEHLNIPSVKGASMLFNRAAEKLHLSDDAHEIFSRPVSLPYPLRYTLDYFKLGFASTMVPGSLRIPLWAGVLEAGITPQY